MRCDEGSDPLHDRTRVVVDAGGDLARRDRAVLGEQDDIGEGAADIDADAPAAHAPLSGALPGVSGIGPRETAGGAAHPRAALSSARRASVPARSTCQRGAVDDHAIVVARGVIADQLVAQVAQHGVRVALQRVAPAAGTGELVAEDVALHDGLGELARERALAGPGVHQVARGLAGAAAIEPVGPEGVAVGAHLEQPLGLEKAIVAAERGAAPVAPGAGAVRHELVREDLQRIFGLGHFDRLRRHVGEDVGVAVEAIGPGPGAPGAAGEIDVDEGLSLIVVAADGDTGIAAVGGGEDLVRQHHRERPEGAIDHAEAGEPARRAGRRQHGVGDGAGRGCDGDGAEDALVVGNPGRQDRADRRVGGGLGPRQRAVDRPLHLRRRPGPVGVKAVAFLAQRHEQPDRLAAVDAVVVDPVLEAGLAVRQIAQRRPGQALGIVDDLLQIEARGGRAVLAHQIDELALRDVAGRELGAQVAEELDRQAHVLFQKREQRFVARAPVVEAERRNPHALLIDLGRIGGIGAGDPAADIGVVADRRGEGQAVAAVEDRLEHEDIRQMHAAVERVVHHEHVAGVDVVAEVPQHR